MLGKNRVHRAAQVIRRRTSGGGRLIYVKEESGHAVTSIADRRILRRWRRDDFAPNISRISVVPRRRRIVAGRAMRTSVGVRPSPRRVNTSARIKSNAAMTSQPRSSRRAHRYARRDCRNSPRATRKVAIAPVAERIVMGATAGPKPRRGKRRFDRAHDGDCSLNRNEHPYELDAL